MAGARVGSHLWHWARASLGEQQFSHQSDLRLRTVKAKDTRKDVELLANRLLTQYKGRVWNDEPALSPRRLMTRCRYSMMHKAES